MKINIAGITKTLNFFPELQVKTSDETKESYRFDCIKNLMEAYDLKGFMKFRTTDNTWYVGKIQDWEFTLTKRRISLYNILDESKIEFKIDNDRLPEWLEDNFYTKFENPEFIKYIESLASVMYYADSNEDSYKELLEFLADNLEEVYTKFKNKKAKTN